MQAQIVSIGMAQEAPMTVRSVSFPVFVPSRSLRPRHLWTLARAMMQARQTRRLLGEMDERMLADIGVGRGDALVEASRPMWDLAPRRR